MGGRMQQTGNMLGIDVGSVSVGVVVMDRSRKVVAADYRVHRGQVRVVLQEIIGGWLDRWRVNLVAATASTPDDVVADQRYHNQVAVNTAARRDVPRAAGVLQVGGEKFSLALFDGSGAYRGTRSNTSCAAGTGAFLDQQAARLGLGSAERLGRTALSCVTECPKIASRCAVFAKTDLIHAQQEGYQLEEISDGLCRGLAKNIVDTLFSEEISTGEIVFCGGVSRNRAVTRHIGELTGLQITVPPDGHLYGAIGACLCLFEDIEHGQIGRDQPLKTANELFREVVRRKQYAYQPLELHLSDYPDFASRKRYEFSYQVPVPVEVDIYADLDAATSWDVQLGIDIGSTSTKAVLLNRTNEVVAGFYTRTAGRPLAAVQAIFRAVAAIENETGRRFAIAACGTTGSGRKFIGAIVGADLVIDEITAHARAACQLNPSVDTIIEIGGQDAKFTTLVDGRVTSSTMNTVCAAGTGSFIEEQAARLNCPLTEMSDRTAGVAAPLASDRCTVFMERDINHLLSEGYQVDEVLAAVLHSVRENYLLKVATEKSIGEVICFQGATAKNRSLVAAFEQRLGKPIQVSPFCHLTGALGTALILDDEKRGEERSSRFAGIGIHNLSIPIKAEICELCTNHCKLSVAEVDGRKVAYGFLCGRDYETQSYVKKELPAYDLLGRRRKTLELQSAKRKTDEIVVGLPTAVHLLDDLGLWQRFFSYLDIPTMTSRHCRDALKRGTYLRKAEFCAPVTAMHGHVEWLLQRADYVFLPTYLEEKSSEARRQYCYYTQFLGPLTGEALVARQDRLLTPVVRYLYTTFHTKMQLYRMLQPITRRQIGFVEVSSTYDRAVSDHLNQRQMLQEDMAQRLQEKGVNDFSVVLLGRPYNTLSPELNGGIPDIFRNLDIDVFYQDMMSVEPEAVARIRPLLDELHWKFAASILETAEVIGSRPGLYPVYLTSFKCSPDSFALDYFKRIMAYHNKPYLILELDEHGSNVGYETRIEAAVRSFRNHHSGVSNRKKRRQIFINPHSERAIEGKTVVFPNWDQLTCSLLVAVLQHEGIDAVLMQETRQSIRKSLQHNTGQCIPLNAVAQGYMDIIRERQLDPARTVLWLNESHLACNIRLYPHHIRTILSDHGLGDAGVYLGNLSFSEISLRAVKNAYFSYLFGGMLRKVCCRIRPYECYPGETDRVLDRALVMLCEAFRDGTDKGQVLSEIISRFEWIEKRPEWRPKVAIFGDLYSRDNNIMNQDLIRFIERHGGEALTTPYSDYAKMIAFPYFRKWLNEGRYLSVLSNTAALVTMKQLEKSYYAMFNRILDEPIKEFNDSPEEILSRYGVAIEHTGESMDNLLKVHYTKKYHPDVALFVQASPALCCASLITEAMRGKIEAVTGVPVVSVTYDGTGGAKNEVIIPYLRYLREGVSVGAVHDGAGMKQA